MPPHQQLPAQLPASLPQELLGRLPATQQPPPNPLGAPPLDPLGRSLARVGTHRGKQRGPPPGNPQTRLQSLQQAKGGHPQGRVGTHRRRWGVPHLGKWVPQECRGSHRGLSRWKGWCSSSSRLYRQYIQVVMRKADTRKPVIRMPWFKQHDFWGHLPVCQYIAEPAYDSIYIQGHFGWDAQCRCHRLKTVMACDISMSSAINHTTQSLPGVHVDHLQTAFQARDRAELVRLGCMRGMAKYTFGSNEWAHYACTAMLHRCQQGMLPSFHLCSVSCLTEHITHALA